SAIPNMKNLISVQQHPSFDQNRDYTLPWQSGMTGIAYNDKLSDPVLSAEDLLTNPKLKGKVTCLNSMGDALTVVMLENGDDPTVQGFMEAGDQKQNVIGIYYIPPVAGAGQWAKKYDPSVAKNPLIFPTKEMLSKVKIFDSKALNNQKYLTAWQNLISG